MKYSVKKYVAFLLTLIMVLNTIPLTGFAGTSNTVQMRGSGSEEGDVFVSITNTGTEQLPQLTEYYYLVVGWNEGVESYAYKGLQQSLSGDYSFNTAALSHNGNTLYILLKKCNSLSDDPRDQSGEVLVSIPDIGQVGSTASKQITLGGEQYTLNLSEITNPNATDGKRRFSITVSKSPRHTVDVTLPNGAYDMNTYVVFFQMDGSNAAFCVEKLNNGNGTYESDAVFHSYNGDVIYDNSDNKETNIYLLRTKKDLDDRIYNDLKWVIVNASNSGEYEGTYWYGNNSDYWNNTSEKIVITNTPSTHSATIRVAEARYTAKVEFYNGFNVQQTPSFSGTYSFTATTADNQVYTGIMNNDGTIAFKDSDNNSISDIPAISSWSMSSASFEDDYVINLTPEISDENVYIFK